MGPGPRLPLTNRASALGQRVRAVLPTGHSVSVESWNHRHRAITNLLWAHVLAVPVYGVLQGEVLAHALLEGFVIAALAIGATSRAFRPLTRSVMATLGLVSASAILTHFSGGLIEMHFHFFVVVAVVSLYQSWVPFLVALGFVVAHHGIGGELLPTSVFNHEAALRNSWTWALIHGGFILAESTACLVAWRLNEIALEGERAARDAMQKANEDLAAAQALSSVGSWDWDPAAGSTVWWSDELYRIVGREPGSFVPTRDAFLDHVAPEDRDRVKAAIEHGQASGSLEYECTIVRIDGKRRIIHTLGHVVMHDDGAKRFLGTCQDITERKALEAEIEHRAFHDALTGLANRALLLDRLDHGLAMSDRTEAPLSLLYLDIDDFKTINDNLGHGRGDEVLVRVAERLAGSVRSSDTVARLGGDEFALLLENTPAERAAQVAQKLLDALAEPIALDGATSLLVRASIGIAVGDGATGPTDLLRHADIAMYAAKRNGKNAFRVFNESMHSSLVTRMQLEAELAEAITQEQFVLHYQPLVDLRTRKVQGVEALVRWDHPTRGMLPPSEFIPLAEELGSIVELGEWVMRRAARDATLMQDAIGRPLYLSVNVAAPQLHTDFVETISDALAMAGLDPRYLLIELTETSVMTPEEGVLAKLVALREMGVRVAIDDFGTGYSSLAYLKQLPIDLLKIDRSFTRNIAGGPEESALAHSIIKLASVFGLHTVGEGIETLEQEEILRDLGCESGQGYLFSRPVDLLSLIRGLEDSHEEPAFASALSGR